MKPQTELRLKNFIDALNSDFNTPLALSSFFSIIDEINNLASHEMIAKSIADYLLPILRYMLNIIGLKINEFTKEENEKIKKLVEQRKIFRDEKNYEGADNIRRQLSDDGIVLIDHKKRTIWMKQEKIGN